MDIVLTLHSIVRWLLLVVAMITAVKFVVGWLQKHPFQPIDRGLLAGFVGLIDMQLVLGLILLIGYRTFTMYQIEHAITMVVVLLGVHLLPRRWRDAPAPIRFRNNFLVIVGAFVLILLGISVLPGDRWTFP